VGYVAWRCRSICVGSMLIWEGACTFAGTIRHLHFCIYLYQGQATSISPSKYPRLILSSNILCDTIKDFSVNTSTYYTPSAITRSTLEYHDLSHNVTTLNTRPMYPLRSWRSRKHAPSFLHSRRLVNHPLPPITHRQQQTEPRIKPRRALRCFEIRA